MSRTRTMLALATLAGLLLTACTVPEPTAPTTDRADDVAARPTAARPLGPGSPDEPLAMAFVPAPERPDSEAAAASLARLLAAETGLEIQARAYATQAEVVAAMADETAHVAWLDAFHYLEAHDASGATPLLVLERAGETGYAGQILVGADRRIDTLDDLVGQRFCRPDPDSIPGWLLPLLTLRAFGLEAVDIGQVTDAGSDADVVRALYAGDCDAGATAIDARDALADELADVADVVAVLALTGPVPHDSLTALAGLAPDTADKIRDGLLAVSMTRDGQDALRGMHGVDALQPADDALYDDLRTALERAGLTVEALLGLD